MTKDEALKLSMEAMEITGGFDVEITAIKEALAEQDSKDKEQAKTDSFVRQLDEALAQPWEKFCDSNCVWTGHHPDCKLAEPEQEPVVWMYQDKSTHEVRFQKHMRDFVDHSKTSEVPLYSEPLANHELQCVCGAVWCGDEMVHLPNKAPPQRNKD